MANGKVKKWLSDRGFGFITPDDGSPDLFVHVRSILSGATSLPEGASVQYEPGVNARNGKTEAQKVRVL